MPSNLEKYSNLMAYLWCFKAQAHGTPRPNVSNSFVYNVLKSPMTTDHPLKEQLSKELKIPLRINAS